MELIDVVDKLVGRIEPIGDTSVDEERFENLKAYCELINEMVKRVDDGNAYLTGLSICGIYKESLNDLKENAYFEANGYDIDNSIVGKKIIGNVTDNPELME